MAHFPQKSGHRLRFARQSFRLDAIKGNVSKAFRHTPALCTYTERRRCILRTGAHDHARQRKRRRKRFLGRQRGKMAPHRGTLASTRRQGLKNGLPKW